MPGANMSIAAASDLSLPPTLDLAAAEGLCGDLTAALGDGGVSLDGAAVEWIATPCLQVLAAAATTARARNLPFRLVQASSVLRAAITDLGLHQALPCED